MGRASRLTVVALVAVMLAATGGSIAYFVEHDDARPKPTQQTSPTQPPQATMPNVVGKDYDGAAAALAAAGITVSELEYRAVANASVPANRVVSQDPAAGISVPADGSPVSLEVSAGGPTITFDKLPASVRAFTETLANYDPRELVLVTTTAKGIAYKTDAWLFGPCAAVDAAYRTYQDPRYDDRCY
jgi:hypothetical protein